MAWTILQALAARDELAGEHEVRVVVSTEDQELAAIARHYGAEVPFMRPAHLAEDTTATEPVIEHAIEFYTGEGWAPDAVMLLQATSPVRLPSTLARAVRQFAENGKDSLVGVIPIGPFIWRWHPDAEPTAEFEIMARPRRQELTQETFRYRKTVRSISPKLTCTPSTTTVWRGILEEPLIFSRFMRSRASILMPLLILRSPSISSSRFLRANPA